MDFEKKSPVYVVFNSNSVGVYLCLNFVRNNFYTRSATVRHVDSVQKAVQELRTLGILKENEKLKLNYLYSLEERKP